MKNFQSIVTHSWSTKRYMEDARMRECECGYEFDPLYCDDPERELCDECHAKMTGEWDYRIRESYKEEL